MRHKAGAPDRRVSGLNGGAPPDVGRAPATNQAGQTVVCRATGGRAPPQGRRTSPQCGWAWSVALESWWT